MPKFIIKEHDHKPLRWWYEMRDKIDFEPTYQRRGGIWPVKNKAFLIDSILNGYDIPKMYVADFRLGRSPLNVKNKTYAIIDGKQRFEAIFDFFSDRLKIGAHNPFKFEEDLGLDLNGMLFSQLRHKHPRIAAAFDNYEINVISVWADRTGPIESLFVRLNTSVTVTGAERRNAMQGIVMDITRKLAKHLFFKEKIRFETKRLADQNTAIKLLWMEFNNKLVDTKKAELDGFAESATQPNFDTQRCKKAAQNTKEVLDTMGEVFGIRDHLLNSSGSVPLYYWYIKNIDNQNISKVRDFLEKFEKERQENARRKEAGQDNVDTELLQFDTQRRSPNDSKAMGIMADILLRHFKKG